MADLQKVMGSIEAELRKLKFGFRDKVPVNLLITRTFENPTSGGKDKPVVTSANANRVLAEIEKYLKKTVGKVIEGLPPSEPVVVEGVDKGTVRVLSGWRLVRKRRMVLRISWHHLVEVGKKSVFSQIIFVTITQT